MTQYKSFIQYMKNRWIQYGKYEPPFLGCSHKDLEELMREQKVTYLPELYQEFMLVFGKKSAGLKHTGQFTYPSVLEFKPKTEKLNLPEDCFVFLMEGFDMILYFSTSEQQANPMVHIVRVSDINFSLVSETYCLLSEFLVDWVEEEIEVYQKWR